jgi:hypothetical protein
VKRSGWEEGSVGTLPTEIGPAPGLSEIWDAEIGGWEWSCDLSLNKAFYCFVLGF